MVSPPAPAVTVPARQRLVHLVGDSTAIFTSTRAVRAATGLGHIRCNEYLNWNPEQPVWPGLRADLVWGGQGPDLVRLLRKSPPRPEEVTVVFWNLNDLFKGREVFELIPGNL